MLKVEVVKRVETEDSWHYEENPLLRRIIEWTLQEPLENFVHKLLVKTCKDIGVNKKEADDFWVRVFYNKKPQCGFCYHRNRSEKAVMPDIGVGFANDVSDFAVTIVHEALHALRWDEDMVEKKALEIVGVVK